MAEKTDLLDHLGYGFDAKNRRIYFGIGLDVAENGEHSDVTMSSVEFAIRSMHRMASESPNKPIEIHMGSYGGDPYAMLRLHDEILASPCQIKFFGGGVIMSSATWIMAVCDERYLHPNTTVMVHDGVEGLSGKHTDVQIEAAELKRLQNLLYEIYANNSRMPHEFWADVCQRDLHLTAQETVMLGLADKVIEPKKRGNLRKVRQASMKKISPSADMKKLISNLYHRINKVKVPKIDINDPVKEPSDPSIFIDNSPLETEKAQMQQSAPEPIKTSS